MKKKGSISPWNDELVDYIKARWAAGDTAGQISKKLREQKVLLSRNAIISKLHREGVLGRVAPKTSRISAVSNRMSTRATRARGSGQSVAAKSAHTAILYAAAKRPRRERRSGEHEESLAYIRATVPYEGVHPTRAEHLTLSVLSDCEEEARKRGETNWQRCRWPTSSFAVRETTYCAVRLSIHMKGAYCAVHAYRLQQKTEPSDALRAEISRALAKETDATITEPM